MPTKDNGERLTFTDSGRGVTCGGCGFGIYAHECPSAARPDALGDALREMREHAMAYTKERAGFEDALDEIERRFLAGKEPTDG